MVSYIAIMIRASLFSLFLFSYLLSFAQTAQVAQSLSRNAFSLALDEGNGNYYIVYSMDDAFGTDVDFDRDSTSYLYDNNGQDQYVVKYDVHDSLLWILRLRGSTLSLKDLCYDPGGDLVASVQFSDSVGIGRDTVIYRNGSEAALVKLNPSDGSLRSYHPFLSKGTVDLVKFQIVNEDYLVCLNGSDSVDIDLRSSVTIKIPSGEHSVKMEADGRLLWSTPEVPFSYSHFSSDTSGGLYVLTYVNGARTRVFHSPSGRRDTVTSSDGYTYLLYKRDKNGVFQYANFMDGGQVFLDPYPTSQNGLYISGFTGNGENHAYEFQNGDSVIKESGGYGAFLGYMRANGDMIWYKQFDDRIWDVFYNVGHDKDDNAYCSGRFRDTLDADWGPKESWIWPASAVNNELNAFVVKCTKDATFSGAFAIGDIQQSDHLFTLSGNKFLVGGYARFGRNTDFDPGNARLVADPDSTPTQDYLAIYSYPDVLYDTLRRRTCKDRFYLYGKTYTRSGIYQDTLESEFRPRYLTLMLEMLESTNGSIRVSGCDSVALNGFTYYQSGIYNQQLKNDAGCDSTLKVFADVHASTDTTLYLQSCEGVMIQDTIYERDGVYKHSFTSVHGCDSVVTYHIEILTKDTGVVYAENCSFVLVNGTVYRETGTYYQRMKRSGQCDSIVVVDVEIFGRDTLKRIMADCKPLQYQDQTFDKTGIYHVRLEDQHGCDSIIQVRFTLQVPDTMKFPVTSCGVFAYQDTVFESEGVHLYIDKNKCDTVLEIDLTFEALNTTVSREGDTLIAAQEWGTYQWRDCEANDDIAGATGRTFRPLNTGEYQVIMSLGSCLDTSECFLVDQLTVPRPRAEFSLKIFPNPARDLIHVRCNSAGDKQIEVYTMGGQLVNTVDFAGERTTIDVKDLAPGIYMFVTSFEGQVLRKRILKY